MDAMRTMEQAVMTADHYMIAAMSAIDKRLGNGYAKDNPCLVGAFMQTAAADFQAMWLGQALSKTVTPRHTHAASATRSSTSRQTKRARIEP